LDGKVDIGEGDDGFVGGVEDDVDLLRLDDGCALGGGGGGVSYFC
jgi:hypothetical protein